ncbi:MAG TPA: hypothetical protein VKQ29_18260 [Aliidongia sp.]|nr:hypothetical protein [Aliidongia sp.]
MTGQPDVPPAVPVGDAEALLRQAAAHAASLALLDAVQHVQRVTILTEAATATVLQRAMAGEQKGLDPALEPIEAIRAGALAHFQAAGLAAIKLFEALSKV